VPLLAGPAPESARLVETGIKVIDLLCPLVAGGSVAIAGELRAGTTVVMEEMVRRLSVGSAPVTIFVMMPPPSEQWPPSLEPGYSYANGLQAEGYSEGTVGPVQTFFFRGVETPWTPERLAALDPVDAVLHLSAEMGLRHRIYPTVDPLTSRSRWLDTPAVSAEHADVARRVRAALAAARAGAYDAEPLLLERARKLEQFFGQPFYVAELYTKRSGTTVTLGETIATCRDILAGAHDDLSVDAFRFAGSIDEIRGRAALE
jgi:F0F1-type ATP synthase beta subunit